MASAVVVATAVVRAQTNTYPAFGRTAFQLVFWGWGALGIIFLAPPTKKLFLAPPTKKIPHWKPSAHMLGACTFCAHHRSDYPPPGDAWIHGYFRIL